MNKDINKALQGFQINTTEPTVSHSSESSLRYWTSYCSTIQPISTSADFGGLHLNMTSKCVLV